MITPIDGEVSDSEFPEAWPASWRELRSLDENLRCPICGDFLSTALALPACSHSFCAMCIRSALQFKEMCPVCREPTQQNLLKSNSLLDTLVSHFTALRPRLLRTLSNPSPPMTQPVATRDQRLQDSGPRRSKRHKSSSIQTPAAPPTTNRGSASTSDPLGSQCSPAKPCASDDESDWQQSQGSQGSGGRARGSLRRRARRDSSPPTPANAHAAKHPKQEAAPPAGKTRCPVCSAHVLEKFIVEHVEHCLVRSTSSGANNPGSSNQSTPPLTIHSRLDSKQQGLQAPVVEPKKMPSLVYNLMSDKALKKLLTDANLSTKGDRKSLVQRHKNYVLHLNCLIDGKKKVDVSAVAAQVQKLERQRAQAENSQASLAHHQGKKSTLANSDAVYKELILQVQARNPRRKAGEHSIMKGPCSEAARDDAPASISEQATAGLDFDNSRRSTDDHSSIPNSLAPAQEPPTRDMEEVTAVTGAAPRRERAGDASPEMHADLVATPSSTGISHAVAFVDHGGRSREELVYFDDEDTQYETLSLSQVDPYDKVKHSEWRPPSSMVVDENP